MGIYKRITKIVGIYIPLCVFFAGCGENTNELRAKYENLEKKYNEMQSDKQFYVEKSDKKMREIDAITAKLASVSNSISFARNAEGNTQKQQAEKIADYISSIENELDKARKGEASKETLGIIKNLQSIVNAQKKEIDVLRTVNSAWLAFNKNDYEEAFSLFLSSDESSKREGSAAFLNTAIILKSKIGCDDFVKKLLLKAQKLNNTTEIREIIQNCR
ncbi:MAG: OmpH family outer membrane protein [Prevotellaceae bacterium]|jgi:hypothetical protein|nr:OmpH family outer membrane protein [Prevotellaceae bacterium]